jgi:hypothetical protein
MSVCASALPALGSKLLLFLSIYFVAFFVVDIEQSTIKMWEYHDKLHTVVKLNNFFFILEFSTKCDATFLPPYENCVDLPSSNCIDENYLPCK